MIKTKNSASFNRINKKSIRPLSSGTNLSKKTHSSRLIHTIISSIQKNVKDLKIYYQKEELNQLPINREKSQKGFRIKRGLTRNSSQSNLNLKNQDKNQNDIFQIRNQYAKVNGRTTNNIIELYQFYKKNLQKREKSTRIMASMELSNGGQSISGGKQSLLKHSQLLNHRQINKRDKDQQKIDQKNQEQNNNQPTKSPIKMKKGEKTSELANQLISKGCYNIMNIANLLNCKKYRLTKQKQQSFKKPKFEKAKQIPNILQTKEIESNKQNGKNLSNIILRQERSVTSEIKISNRIHQQNKNVDIPHSPQFIKKPEISFKNNIQTLNGNKTSNGKSFQCSSISKQDKDIQKKIFQESSVKKQIQNEKVFTKIKLEELLNLEEHPIEPRNTKQFEKSKYYVKPIPQKKHELQNEKSISLRSTSRIIDIDSLPFDL